MPAEIDVLVIERSPTEQLRIGIGEFSGKRFVNLRTWWHSGDADWKPGKQGLTLRAEEHQKVAEAILQAAAKLHEA